MPSWNLAGLLLFLMLTSTMTGSLGQENLEIREILQVNLGPKLLVIGLGSAEVYWVAYSME
jgi:hypothetical protein